MDPSGCFVSWPESGAWHLRAYRARQKCPHWVTGDVDADLAKTMAFMHEDANPRWQFLPRKRNAHNYELFWNDLCSCPRQVQAADLVVFWPRAALHLGCATLLWRSGSPGGAVSLTAAPCSLAYAWPSGSPWPGAARRWSTPACGVQDPVALRRWSYDLRGAFFLWTRYVHPRTGSIWNPQTAQRTGVVCSACQLSPFIQRRTRFKMLPLGRALPCRTPILNGMHGVLVCTACHPGFEHAQMLAEQEHATAAWHGLASECCVRKDGNQREHCVCPLRWHRVLDWTTSSRGVLIRRLSLAALVAP